MSCESLDLDRLAERIGTPCYVYSKAAFVERYRSWADAFAWGGGTVAYAIKANSHHGVLKALAAEGAGADTVSVGEIRKALKAGVPARRIVFSGMGKTDVELSFALTHPELQINVESRPELERLKTLARASSARPVVVLRVNPDVSAGGHDKISTGRAHDKFGLPIEEAMALYREASSDGALNIAGLACHIGSQIFDVAPFEAAWRRLAEMTVALREDGLTVSRLDLGGGLGIDYGDGSAPSNPATPADLGAAARRIFGDLGVELSVEPGRWISAPSGILLASVTHVNTRASGLRFLVLDAGMNDLARPSLYDAFHRIEPLVARHGETLPYDVVGPICESSDVFARDRMLPALAAADRVALMDAGAYGAAMASTYNSRDLPAEVLVDGSRWTVTRTRQIVEEDNDGLSDGLTT